MEKPREASPSDLQCCVRVSLLALVVYAQTLFFGYTHFDDAVLILADYDRLRRWSYLLTAFREHTFQVLHDGSAVFYRPMLTLSFFWDAHFWHINPFASAFGCHLTNLLLHAVAAALVFLFLARAGCERRLSLLGAALFAVHPALAQAVAWIPGRNDVLLGIFTFSSFLAFMEFKESGRRRWLLAHGALWLAALLTKESAVALPALCLLYERLLVRPGKGGASRRPWAIWAACAAVWLGLRRLAMGPGIAGGHLSAGLSAAVRAALPQTVYCAGKALLPFNLSVLTSLPHAGLGWGLAALALLAVGLALPRRRPTALTLFGAAWAVLFLAPTFLAAPRFDPAYPIPIEQRLYVPMAGLLIVVLEIARSNSFLRRRAFAVFLPIVALFGVLAARHSRVFEDPVRFWQAAVQDAPGSFVTHQNLAGALGEDGRWDQAVGEFKQAIALSRVPSYKAHQSLGLAYTKLGDWDAARGEFQEALAINPRSEQAHFGLATVDYQQKAFSAADDEWLRALRLDPDDAMDGLTVCYFVEKRQEEALRYLKLTEGSGLASDPRVGTKLAAFQSAVQAAARGGL